MLPLGLLVYPYLVILLSTKLKKFTKFQYFSFGYFYGLGFLIIYLIWIRNPFLVNETTKSYQFFFILLPMFLSIFYGIFFIIYTYFNSRKFLILLTPLIFFLVEFAISNFFYGFPWVSNSLILSNNYFGLILIKFFGSLTSGFLIILILLTPIFLIDKNNFIQTRKSILFIYFPFLMVLILFTNLSVKEPLKKIITIDVHQIMSPVNARNHKSIEEEISDLINNSDKDFILFAENNFPYILEDNNFENISFLRDNDKTVIIGATSFKNKNFYNSFFLFENNLVKSFDKKILVPFGEFLPLRKYLKFMEEIAGKFDFEKGNAERVIKTNDNIYILPIICYEIVFDNIFHKINENKIDLLINITNDVWFGEKIGPYQHFYISRTKSLIANKPLVRVSNNGISAIIDNNGKIIKSSQLNQKTNFTHSLEILSTKSFNKYHYIFNSYLFLLLVLFVFSRKKNYEF